MGRTLGGKWGQKGIFERCSYDRMFWIYSDDLTERVELRCRREGAITGVTSLSQWKEMGWGDIS